MIADVKSTENKIYMHTVDMKFSSNHLKTGHKQFLWIHKWGPSE